MRPLAGPTLRAGAWNRAMRCYSLLVWIDHTASAAPSLARFQAPAQARFSAAQAPDSGTAPRLDPHRLAALVDARLLPGVFPFHRFFLGVARPVRPRPPRRRQAEGSEHDPPIPSGDRPYLKVFQGQQDDSDSQQIHGVNTPTRLCFIPYWP